MHTYMMPQNCHLREFYFCGIILHVLVHPYGYCCQNENTKYLPFHVLYMKSG